MLEELVYSTEYLHMKRVLHMRGHVILKDFTFSGKSTELSVRCLHHDDIFITTIGDVIDGKPTCPQCKEYVKFTIDDAYKKLRLMQDGQHIVSLQIFEVFTDPFCTNVTVILKSGMSFVAPYYAVIYEPERYSKNRCSSATLRKTSKALGLFGASTWSTE